MARFSSLAYAGLFFLTLFQRGSSTNRLYNNYWNVYDFAGQPLGTQINGMNALTLFAVDMQAYTNATAGPFPFTAYLNSTNGMGAWDGDSLRSQYQKPDLITIALFGGWGLDAPFRAFSNNPQNQKAFATGAVDFIDAQHVQGIDIDWEFPVDLGAEYHGPSPPWQQVPVGRQEPNSADAANFVQMLQAVKDEMTRRSQDASNPKTYKKHYYLTISVPALSVDFEKWLTPGAVTQLNGILDWYNCMSFDAQNRRSNGQKAGPQAGYKVMTDLIDALVKVGVPHNKMVMGVPFYADAFPINQPCDANTVLGQCVIADGMENTLGWDTGSMFQQPFDPALYHQKAGVLDQSGETAWGNVLQANKYDDAAKAHWGYDGTTQLYWSWVDHTDIKTACDLMWNQTTSPYHDVLGLVGFSLNADFAGNPGFAAMAQCFVDHPSF